MFKGLTLAAGAALITALAFAGTASAQYPEPKGNLVCTTKVVVEISETHVTATLRDSSGHPVANKMVYFNIVAGGGSLDYTSDDTDGNGQAWVRYTGSNATIAATYDGLECRAVAQVLGSTFRPPSTGDGGLVGGSTSDTVVFGAALLVMGVTGLSFVALRRQRVRADS